MTAAVATLIGVDELSASLDQVLLLDVRFDLARPAAGREAYLDAHIPGAPYRHLDEDLSAPLGSSQACSGGRHPLPTREELALRAGCWGVRPGQPVVVYDAQGGMFAARLWWLLRWLGHDQVRVLDGGWPAWQRAAGPSASGDEPAVPAALGAPYPLSAEPGMRTLDADALAAQLGRCALLDARAPERFRGDIEPLDPVAGHIPGAQNRPFMLNLDAQGCFLPAQALRTAYAPWVADGAGQVVHQCGSGVTACHNLLAMEVAGLSGSALYPGSWSEWCRDPARPVARG
jgi:thiosulfate/3-mercaptopyruvate sulfurtransferase